MLECRACVLRAVRAIASDGSNVPNVLRSRTPLLLTPRLSGTTPARRSASTSAATRPVDPDDFVPGAQPIDEPSTDPKKQRGIVIRDEKALKTELQYLEDPLKLAEHVRYTLRCKKPDKALDLCRLASKQQQVIVSWNHCIDWHMSNGRIDDALKIYNEMKKRAQFPDSYTYVLIMRGLARPHHHGALVKQSNVTKAVSIYNSMSSPTSRVRPSIFHTNATLKVCSAALDMDALWGIASKLPKRGPGAPDHMTYAILLHAIRHGAMGNNPEGPFLEQIAARRQEAVSQGRRIWQEVIPKWRAGEIHIDEELVCAMGRLLLLSQRMQDWDDVLNLVHQTMQIDRQVAPLGSPDRHTEHVPQDNELPDSEAEKAEDAQGYVDAPSIKAFNTVTPLPPSTIGPRRPSTLAYVQPGNPTLSMLIGACTVLRVPKAANAYWDLLTDPQGDYALKADLPNYHAQLRLLGKNRSSAKAIHVLKSMSENESGLEPKNQTFRIAMSICVRDKNNPNALNHARAVVDQMEKFSPDPDVHTLIQYLQLALSTDNGPQIVSAIDRLDPIIHNLKSRVTYGAEEQKPSDEDNIRDKQETVAFFQVVVGAVHSLMTRGLVPQEDYAHWTGRRNMLQQFISRAQPRLGRHQDRVDTQVNESRRNQMNDPLDDETSSTAGREGSFNRATRQHKRQGEGQQMQMSRTEYALKKLRWQEKRKTQSRIGRERARGLREWDVGQEEKRIAAGGGRNGAFADSPMELAGR